MELIEGVTAFNGKQVPYTLKWINGHPDFTEVDTVKVEQCLKDRLCGICGDALGDVIAFVGGSKSTAFIDPPNHPECAMKAFAECPFLKNSRVRDEQDTGDYSTFFAFDYRYYPGTLVSWPVRES